MRTPGWALLSPAVSLGLTLCHPFFWLPFSPPFSLPFLSPRPTHRITLLEAARIGLIPRTTRRLTRGERADLIDDGAVRPLPLLLSAQGRFVCSTLRARLRIWPPSLLTRPLFYFLCRTGVHLGGAGDADAGPSLNALLRRATWGRHGLTSPTSFWAWLAALDGWTSVVLLQSDGRVSGLRRGTFSVLHEVDPRARRF